MGADANSREVAAQAQIENVGSDLLADVAGNRELGESLGRGESQGIGGSMASGMTESLAHPLGSEINIQAVLGHGRASEGAEGMAGSLGIVSTAEGGNNLTRG